MTSETDITGRPGATATPAEDTLGALLAGVMGQESIPVDSHFFDELGADSLLMAHFCARVRKQADLPPISMRDVYAHPTIRSLAAALADAGPVTARTAAVRTRHLAAPTSAREYVLCGVLQALFYLGYTYVGVLAAIKGYQSIVAGTAGIESYLRLVLLSGVAVVVVCAVPILAKWLLIGRWKPQQVRIWSFTYVRFWVVKTLIRSNPGIQLLIGSPLYGLYLRALGASVGSGVVILSRSVPICTDLLSIGAGTVVRRESAFACYRAQAGFIHIGPVTLGRDVLVGERAVLDINAAMGDRAQLGHGSSLQSGQTVPAGEHWHGSPALRTEVDYASVAPARCGKLRRACYAALTLLGVVLLYVPVLEGGLDLLAVAVSSWVNALAPGLRAGAGGLPWRALLFEATAFSLVLFVGVLSVGLLAAGAVPRVLSHFIKPDTIYPLYGFHYGVHRVISGLGKMKFFTFLFGDSAYIVHYLSWLGYRLAPVVQTGSNFGIEVMASTPFLTSIGSGTMVADGLNMINDEISGTSFRLSRAVIGTNNFVGNDVVYPCGGRTAGNCLLATKAMIPLDGKVHEGRGLLGSPPFEIPRSVERDSRYDHLCKGEALRRGLAAKTRYNLWTIGIFLFTRWLGILLVTVIDLAAVEFFYDAYAHAIIAGLFSLTVVVAAGYYALVERCVVAIGPQPPSICSIYDPAFWHVERIWKLHPIHFFHVFDGTPFKSMIWRLMGVRIGRRLFDDGVHISEPTLTVIGDDCVLNYRSKVQCHSQEDGTFKSERSTLGDCCTIGVGALVHYGVTMGDGSELAADSFLMKGEEVPAFARWAGNPAKETSDDEYQTR
ncbi:Pls/PosA family non-ribosomal peptide synthetase [Burkholderia ubonensis]|uniref:Pls/PosA family non-ribosomal peptide synthetase n=1 Tax=Burkholderia ubonensis TaxID=101571 RepID=UPI00075BA699|nr:Pls/PosA family non-ribosomal peptide synthetase [Burkholderia ubonensis]KVZ04299.1 peptide synthetase [Burkholderia ubonensis]